MACMNWPMIRSSLSYDGLNATLELTSVNRTAGKLVFGFADGNGVAQDEVLATVRFRPRDAYTCEYGMTLTSREMNDTMPETREQIQVGSHSWDGGVVTKAPHLPGRWRAGLYLHHLRRGTGRGH